MTAQHKEPDSAELSIGELWKERSTDLVVIMLDHVPLIGGIFVTAIVHAVRTLIAIFFHEGDATSWGATLVDSALLLTELGLFIGLVLPQVINVITELLETVGVGVFRVRYAWREGRRYDPNSSDKS